jgi:hypothetical protein
LTYVPSAASHAIFIAPHPPLPRGADSRVALTARRLPSAVTRRVNVCFATLYVVTDGSDGPPPRR